MTGVNYSEGEPEMSKMPVPLSYELVREESEDFTDAAPGFPPDEVKLTFRYMDENDQVHEIEMKARNVNLMRSLDQPSLRDVAFAKAYRDAIAEVDALKT